MTYFALPRPCACRIMTSLLDSSAHFEERCAKLGLTPAFVTALAGSHVDNLSKLAFVIGQPGQPIQNQDVTDFLQNALGRAPTLAETTALKRLGFEAHTYLVATLRQQVDQSDEHSHEKLHMLSGPNEWTAYVRISEVWISQVSLSHRMGSWTNAAQFLTATM